MATAGLMERWSCSFLGPLLVQRVQRKFCPSGLPARELWRNLRSKTVAEARSTPYHCPTNHAFLLQPMRQPRPITHACVLAPVT